MKLFSKVSEIEKGGIESKSFTIETSGKMFNLLSSGLYSNKIKAIVRELASNAHDSHIEANCPDRDIDIHLPTSIEPWFSIRDYGVGMDDETVQKVYSTYFASTKTDSNDLTGALGLGSKTPIAYANQFSVTTVKDNVQRTYFIFVGEDGKPNCSSPLSNVSTNDSNGVTVTVPVTNENDYIEFARELVNVFTYIPANANIINDVRVKFRSWEAIYANKITDTIWASDNTTRDVAVQGVVAYPIEYNREMIDRFGHIINEGTLFHFNIGELDITPSRESLSYIDETNESLIKKLEEYDYALCCKFQEKIDECKTDFDFAKLYRETKLSGSRKYVHYFDLFMACNTRVCEIISKSYMTFKFPVTSTYDLKTYTIGSLRGVSNTASNIINGRITQKISIHNECINFINDVDKKVPIVKIANNYSIKNSRYKSNDFNIITFKNEYAQQGYLNYIDSKLDGLSSVVTFIKLSDICKEYNETLTSQKVVKSEVTYRTISEITDGYFSRRYVLRQHYGEIRDCYKFYIVTKGGRNPFSNKTHGNMRNTFTYLSETIGVSYENTIVINQSQKKALNLDGLRDLTVYANEQRKALMDVVVYGRDFGNNNCYILSLIRKLNKNNKIINTHGINTESFAVRDPIDDYGKYASFVKFIREELGVSFDADTVDKRRKDVSYTITNIANEYPLLGILREDKINSENLDLVVKCINYRG